MQRTAPNNLSSPCRASFCSILEFGARRCNALNLKSADLERSNYCVVGVGYNHRATAQVESAVNMVRYGCVRPYADSMK